MDYSAHTGFRMPEPSFYRSELPPVVPLTPSDAAFKRPRKRVQMIKVVEAESKILDSPMVKMNTKKTKKKKTGAKGDIKKGKKRVCQMKKEARLRALADPDRMWNLRMKFVDQLKKYFGVPYAKRYWKPEEPEYSMPYFLDCCGLVRRAMRDLKKDFGFKIGPWNQGYMYDTLPITVENEEDMQPGDLVFIAATYYNTKMKKQKHDITHVEIWLGDGPKTIGSRWHRGHVQVFDSYAFEAKSYHSPSYIFKSIDTWLMGICRSHCPEHQWRLRTENFKPSKKSVFSLKDKKKSDDGDEGASDSEETRIPLQTQDSNISRNPRTPRSIGLMLSDNDEEDDDDLDESDTETSDADGDSTTTGSTTTATTETASDTTSVTTTTSRSSATTAVTGSTADSSSIRSSEGTSTSVGQSSMGSSSTDVSSEVSSTSRSELSEYDRKNLQKDFAKSNPREGKETDLTVMGKRKPLKCVLSYSVGESPRLKSPYSGKNTDLDGNPISARSVSNVTLPAPGSTLFRYDSNMGAYVPKEVSTSENVDTQYGDDSDEENASIGSEDDDVNDNRSGPKPSADSQFANAGCQTGLNFGGSLHTLGRDKWQCPNNMLCYASLCNGEAAVQVKNPDLLSTTSSSDDEGYVPQDQMSFSGDENLTDLPISASKLCEKAGSGRPFSGYQASEDSGLPRCGSASSWVGLSRPSSATSMLARVGSAGHFHAPDVSALYGENSDSSSSSSASENKGSHSDGTQPHTKENGGPRVYSESTIDTSASDTPSSDESKEQGVSSYSEAAPADGDTKQGSNP